jgi:hypothetical protein
VLTTGGAKSVFLRSANTGTATVVADDLDLTPAGTQPDDDAVASATATVQFKPLDSDSDGVPNSTDQCPTVAGPASNHGCPPDVRKTPAGLTLDLAPNADTHSPYTYTAKGKLQRPTGVSKADGCQGVIITRFRYKGTVVATNFNELNGSCKYKNTASFSSSKLPGKGQLKVRSSFGGNDVLKKITSPKRTVGFGH